MTTVPELEPEYPIVLALDSSTTAIGVAVLREGEPVSECAWRAARPSSEGLLSAAQETLGRVGLTVRDVGLVAVATGPGSFNGIRGGIATAQGLAMALDIPAVGVPTLDALAYAHAGRAAVICALWRAGRGEVYGAAYAGNWATWVRRSDYMVGSAAVVLAALAAAPDETLVCGGFDAATVAEAARGIAVAPSFTHASCAPMVGALALRAAAAVGPRAGDGDDSTLGATLRPLYLRRPAITRPRAASGSI